VYAAPGSHEGNKELSAPRTVPHDLIATFLPQERSRLGSTNTTQLEHCVPHGADLPILTRLFLPPLLSIEGNTIDAFWPPQNPDQPFESTLIRHTHALPCIPRAIRFETD
jgi:hypothetical protein